MSQCPRTGQPCSAPKQFNVTEMTPAGYRQIQCCQTCITNQPGFTAIPLQPGMLPVLPNPVAGIQQLMAKLGAKKSGVFVQQQTQMPACEACGATPIQIEQVGRFGCPNCYIAFKDDIESMLMRHHGAVRHVGKVPKAWKARQEAGLNDSKSNVDRAVATVKRHESVPLEDRIKLLEDRMAACVKAEDYEKAALIRDVIKQMKTSVVPSQPVLEPPSPEPSSETPSVAS